MDNLPSVLMRPLEDLGFPGYWLSVCGHLFSEHDENWMTPIPPKKSVEYWHREKRARVRVPLFYPEGREPKKAKTVRLTQTSPDGRKDRREIGVANLFSKIVPQHQRLTALVGYEIHYHDEDSGNTALWNLWYGTARRSTKLRVGWDGSEVFKKLWIDPNYRAQLKFEWRSAIVPPPN
jgi:hypothetical protein